MTDRNETVLPLKDRIAAAVRGHYELLSTAHVRNVTVTTAHAEMIANRVLAVLGEQAKCTFPIAENQPCGKTPDAPVHHEPGIMRHDFRETEQAKREVTDEMVERAWRAMDPYFEPPGGNDEYWDRGMRAALEAALNG